MVEDTGLETWVGKYVQLLVMGDSGPWVGILEEWSDRGVVLRYTEEQSCAEAALSVREEPLRPCLILYPWATLRFVSIELEDQEEG